MKKPTFLLIFLICALCVTAQNQIDTLYYTKEWKCAPHKAFADFYRIACYPADSLQPKQFRDYYISGELHGCGSFIKIDSINDANTIFEGVRITYFKNGNTETVKNYAQGVLNGTFYIYNDDGRISYHPHTILFPYSAIQYIHLSPNCYFRISKYAKQYYQYYISKRKTSIKQQRKRPTTESCQQVNHNV